MTACGEDRGQTTLEWLGIGAVTLAVIAAVVALGPQLGATLNGALRQVSCQVLDSCGSTTTGGDQGATPGQALIARDADGGAAAVDALGAAAVWPVEPPSLRDGVGRISGSIDLIPDAAEPIAWIGDEPDWGDPLGALIDGLLNPVPESFVILSDGTIEAVTVGMVDPFGVGRGIGGSLGREATEDIAAAVARGGREGAEARLRANAARLGITAGQLNASEEAVRHIIGVLRQALAGPGMRTTVAVGVGRASDGTLTLFIGSGGRGGPIPLRARRALEELGLDVESLRMSDGVHAEIEVIEQMAREGAQPITIGATNNICTNCAPAIADSGATAATPLRPESVTGAVWEPLPP